MPSNNNTTSLNDGADAGIGLGSGYGSSIAAQIDSVLSLDNLDEELKNNPKLQELYKNVKHMVAAFLPGDKRRIIADANPAGLSRVPSGDSPKVDEILNQECARAILASLPQSDLNKLIAKVKAKQSKVSKDLISAEQSAAAYAKKFLKAQDPNGKYSASLNASGGKAVLALKIESGETFSFDNQTAKEALPKLMKELDGALSKKRISMKDLVTIATNMKIKFDEGCSWDELKKKIKNVINIYVALVLGKEEGIHASRFDEATTSQIEEILLTTSFGWVTGRVGMNDTSIVAKRKAAEAARAAAKAYSDNLVARSKNDKKYVKTNIKYNKKTGEEKKVVLKTKKRFTGKSKEGYDMFVQSAKAITQQFGLDFDEDTNKVLGAEDSDKVKKLREYLESIGISDASNGNIDALVIDAATQSANEGADIRDQMAKALREKNVKKRKEMLDAIDKRKSTTIVGGIYGKKEQYEQDYSDKIPVISFNNDGELTSETVAKAVPVWVVGEGKPGTTYGGDKEKAAKAKNKDKAYGDEFGKQMFNKLFGDNTKKQLEKSDKKRNGLISRIAGKAKFAKDLIDKYTGEDYKGMSMDEISNKIKADQGYDEDLGPATEDAIGINTSMSIAPQWLDFQKDVRYWMGFGENEDGEATQPRNWSEYLTGLDSYLEKDTSNSEKIAKYLKNVNKFASSKYIKPKMTKSAWRGLDRNYAKAVKGGSEVMPVVDITTKTKNVQTLSDDIKKIGNVLNSISQSTGSVAADTAQLPYYIMSLQEAGLSANAASGGGIAGLVQTVANAAMTAVGEDLKQKAAKTANFATGGTMKARNVSSIITGDAMGKNIFKGGAKPELTTVDWAKKTIDVKPIPKFATGGSVSATTATKESNSGIRSVSRLNTAERNAPMSVGISSGLVKYSKKLSDVDDDGSGTAVKVYSVNTGINDKIKVGDTEMSLFDAVYGIYTMIGALTEAVSSQTEIQASIASGISSLNSTAATISDNMGGDSGGFSFSDEFDAMLAGE